MLKVVLLLSTCLWVSSLKLNQHGTGIESRIIGGGNAVSGQFPFVAAITVTTSDGRYFCGGTLISDKWVCTAGQCVDGAILFAIQLGSNSLANNDVNRVTVATSEYILHPEYNPMTLENDLGLIELRMPVEFSNYLLPIHSLAEDHLTGTSRVVVLGWGQTADEDPDFSDSLKYVAVSVLTNEECRLTYGGQITEEMVCVEGNFNEGTCHGDTGTPLILVVALGNAQLVGISSFISGNGCETTDPSGFTRIFPYKDWIAAATNVTF